MADIEWDLEEGYRPNSIDNGRYLSAGILRRCRVLSTCVSSIYTLAKENCGSNQLATGCPGVSQLRVTNDKSS